MNFKDICLLLRSFLKLILSCCYRKQCCGLNIVSQFNRNYMYLSAEKKVEIFEKYGKSTTNTGSPEAQIELGDCTGCLKRRAKRVSATSTTMRGFLGGCWQRGGEVRDFGMLPSPQGVFRGGYLPAHIFAAYLVFR